MEMLNVFWEDRLVGRLWLDAGQRLIFRYEQDYLESEEVHPLSLGLPLRREPYADDTARPFFSNLLPEGDIRDHIAKILHVSKANDFALLREIGRECAGAVSILPEGHAPSFSGEYLPLSSDELEDMIEHRERTPLLAARKDLRLSLAGAQDKLPVYISGDGMYLPAENAPSSHILKPQIRGFADTVHNEAFCMRLAATVLPTGRVPTIAVWHSRRGVENDALIVERYDRVRDEDGHIGRMHQEDFCQALGYLPHNKYENEGGPCLNECFTLLSDFSTQPIVDRMHLIRWVIFNFLIGNRDAHAKNLAIVFRDGRPHLAPFYDLLCTQVYPDLVSKMSMKVGGEIRPDWVRWRHWERFARDIEVKPALVIDLLREYADRLPDEAQAVADFFCKDHGGREIVDQISDVIDANAKQIHGL